MGEPDRAVKPTIYLVPVHGKRCAAICHSQPGLKLTEVLIEGGQVREIFRQRMIRRESILWILYLDTEGMRVGAEAQLSFVDAAEHVVKQTARFALAVWGRRIGIPLRQIVTRLESTPDFAPDHHSLIRFLALASDWGIRCETIVEDDGFYLASASAVFPDYPSSCRPCLVARDGRLSCSIGVRSLASPGRSLFIIRGEPGDVVFFEVGDRLIQLECEHAPRLPPKSATTWLCNLGAENAIIVARALEEAARAGFAAAPNRLLIAAGLDRDASVELPSGRLDITACVRCEVSLILLGRISSHRPADLRLLAYLSGRPAIEIDWRRLSHVDKRDLGADQQGASGSLRFVALIELDGRATASAIRIEAVARGWHRDSWLRLASPSEADIEALAKAWRPLGLVDDDFLRSLLAPLRRETGHNAELSGAVVFGAHAARMRSNTGTKVSIIIVSDGESEALHRTLVAVLLTAGSTDAEISVLLTAPERSEAVAGKLGEWAALYDFRVEMKTCIGGEMQAILMAAHACMHESIVVIRAGDVPPGPRWLLNIANKLRQRSRTVMIDRLRAVLDSSPASISHEHLPRAVAFNQTAIPAFTRIAREFHTLEAGLGNLVHCSNAEDFCLIPGEDLAVRRQLFGKDSDDLILDRRLDLCLLSAHTQARSQAIAREVRQTGHRAILRRKSAP